MIRTMSRNRVLSDGEARVRGKSNRFAHNLALVNQKLGFFVIGSNLGYLTHRPSMWGPLYTKLLLP